MIKRILGTLLITGTIAGTAVADPGTAAPQESTLPPPSPAQKIPDPPHPDVRAYLLMDYTSGRVLFGEHYDERIDPASLTKMMTSYVIGQELKLGRIHLDDKVSISENAWSKNLGDSSKMFLEIGKTVPVDLLNKGIIIQSGNDACIAMAEHIAGSESSFASLMNEWGKRIGLRGSHFVNSHGLYNEQHYSTAYDMAVLGRALIKDLPEEYKIYSQKEFTFNGIRQMNRNRLLWDTSINVDGIKTGHISQVGYNLVASAVNSSNGMRLISVIIGDVSEKSRAANSLALLRYGLRFYEPYTACQRPGAAEKGGAPRRTERGAAGNSPRCFLRDPPGKRKPYQGHLCNEGISPEGSDYQRSGSGYPVVLPGRQDNLRGAAGSVKRRCRGRFHVPDVGSDVYGRFRLVLRGTV